QYYTAGGYTAHQGLHANAPETYHIHARRMPKDQGARSPTGCCRRPLHIFDTQHVMYDADRHIILHSRPTCQHSLVVEVKLYSRWGRRANSGSSMWSVVSPERISFAAYKSACAPLASSASNDRSLCNRSASPQRTTNMLPTARTFYAFLFAMMA